MNRICLIFSFLGLLFRFCAEDFGEPEYEICVIQNRSEEAIWVFDYMWMEDYNEDSMILTPYEVFNYFDPSWMRKIENGKSFDEWIPTMEEMETGFNLQLLIFKESTRNRYTDDELVENDIYDYRYILSLEDLKACDFTVTYTGQSVRDTD